MEEEQDKYQPSEFLKSNPNFLKGYSFKFEGLSDECERGFTHIVKDLGGTVSRKAKYTLVEKKYFEEKENRKRKDLYHLNFILDSLFSQKLPDIESYRCDNIAYNKSLENSPSILQRKKSNHFNNNSGNTAGRNLSREVINSDDGHPIFQTKSNSISSHNIGETTVRNDISNVTNSDDDYGTILRNKRNKNNSFNNSNITVRNNLFDVTNSDVDDTIVQNKSSNNSNQNNGDAAENNSSNKSNSDEDIPEDEIPIIQKLKQSKMSTKQRDDEILKHNSSKNKKRKLNVLSDSENNSSDKSVNIKSELKSSDSESSGSSDSDSVKNNTLSKSKKVHVKREVPSSSNHNTLSKSKKVHVKREVPSSSDHSTNSDTDSEPLVPKRRKKESVSQKKTNSKTWVDTKDVSNKTKTSNIKINKSPSKSEVIWSKSKIEDREDLKYLFEFDEDNMCRFKRCTFEPGPHESHSFPARVISDEEKKVMLKYLIRNKLIHRAKGIRTWEIMVSNGYLTHRSPDTLRNCLRRVILPNLHKYGLPEDILDEFLLLDEKKSKGKKIWS